MDPKERRRLKTELREAFWNTSVDNIQSLELLHGKLLEYLFQEKDPDLVHEWFMHNNMSLEVRVNADGGKGAVTQLVLEDQASTQLELEYTRQYSKVPSEPIPVMRLQLTFRGESEKEGLKYLLLKALHSLVHGTRSGIQAPEFVSEPEDESCSRRYSSECED